MKLAAFLAGDPLATPPRARITMAAFAEQIGASAPLVTAYCNGAVWPSKQKMEAIIRATGGIVTANDFLEITTPSKTAEPAQ